MSRGAVPLSLQSVIPKAEVGYEYGRGGRLIDYLPHHDGLLSNLSTLSGRYSPLKRGACLAEGGWLGGNRRAREKK